MKFIESKYPVFSGHVQSVSAIVEHEGDCISLVDYLNENDNSLAGQEAEKVNFLDVLMKSKKLEEANEEFAKRITRAAVPIRLDPSIVNGANVRAKFGTLKTEEGTYRTYEFEILKGKSRSSGDVFASLAEFSGGTPYSGFKYVKILDKQ